MIDMIWHFKYLDSNLWACFLFLHYITTVFPLSAPTVMNKKLQFWNGKIISPGSVGWCIGGFCCRYKVESCLLTFSTSGIKAVYNRTSLSGCHLSPRAVGQVPFAADFFRSGVRSSCAQCTMHIVLQKIDFTYSKQEEGLDSTVTFVTTF